MRGYEETACTHCGTLSYHRVGQSFRGPRDEQVCKECYATFEYYDVDQAILKLCNDHKITLKKLAERVQILLITEKE